MNFMEIGVVRSYDPHTQRAVVDTEASQHEISYAAGRSMALDPGTAVPCLTDHHRQPDVHRLKEPRPGDAVCFRTRGDSDEIEVWG